jgi:peptidoglycan/LPS O-acetylase OafA/YrhL
LLALLLVALLGAAWLLNRAVEVPLGSRMAKLVEHSLDAMSDAATARRSRALLAHMPSARPAAADRGAGDRDDTEARRQATPVA